MQFKKLAVLNCYVSAQQNRNEPLRAYPGGNPDLSLPLQGEKKIRNDVTCLVPVAVSRLFIGCTFSRALHQLQFSRAWHPVTWAITGLHVTT